MNTQDLNNTPLRCQRLLIRLRRYNPIAEYISGKLLLVPDALSRNPMQQTHSTTEEDVEVYINCIVKTKSTSSRKLKEISNATSMDSDLQEVIHLTLNGWPRKQGRLNRGVKPYFTHRSDLSVHKSILYFQDRIVIPQNLSRNAPIITHRTFWIKQMPRTSKNVSMVAENIPENR